MASPVPIEWEVGDIGNVLSFGEDAAGELYVLSIRLSLVTAAARRHPRYRAVYGHHILELVPRLEDLMADLAGFEWDAGNATKNWERHQVTQAEAEEVFFNRPVFLQEARQAQRERRYNVLGRTNHDRLLTVVFTIRGGLARVISARPMSRKERNAYVQVALEGP